MQITNEVSYRLNMTSITCKYVLHTQDIGIKYVFHHKKSE